VTNSHVYKILVGKPEGKRSLSKPKQRWEDNIKMGLEERPVAGSREHSNGPSISIEGGNLLTS
jgi:hypothetical protein